ncbi:MAG: CapA family protein, partial [Bryobacteraceae bacterium]
MNHSSLVIWRSSQPADIAARVAVAGDFLPAGTLSLPAGGWPEAARGIECVFRDVDISFANLECPLDTEGLDSRPLGGIGQIVSSPSSSLEYLKAVHSLAIGIANNHSYDFGPPGVERTRAALIARNFIPLGAGRTLREEPEVFVWQGPADVRVGFWAAARASRDLAARRNAGVEPATTTRARFASAALKSQGATYSVALLHCGCLRTNRPDPS